MIEVGSMWMLGNGVISTPMIVIVTNVTNESIHFRFLYTTNYHNEPRHYMASESKNVFLRFYKEVTYD